VSGADFLTRLREQQVLPVLRLPDAAAVAAAECALTAGLSLVELTATTPQWDAPHSRVIAAHDEAVVGPVKLFPAHIGGPRMVRSLRALLAQRTAVQT
jgi:2-keto-3-deoxy-6-phosphogluconate aldolase